ncbi:MAG: SIS domain-containing protein [Bifidobacteriaceae bacterium]|nr:SIS domain-containing protein [Bifidobacteriaceae bacterium]
MVEAFEAYSEEIASRLRSLDRMAAQGGLDQATGILADSLAAGGVIQAFGTGHSLAFAMELAGRAGGFIPTHAIRLQDLVLMGRHPRSALGSSEFERDSSVADQLYDLYQIHPQDAFAIASNSGANGSTVGLALRAQRAGHKVIAVTSLEHSRAVDSKHPSGKRLFEVADVVIDNLSPFGDAALAGEGGPAMGAVSSITAAYIAQLLTLGTADRLRRAGAALPVYLSSNIPEGDEHNNALEERFGPRIKPYRYLPDGA